MSAISVNTLLRAILLLNVVVVVTFVKCDPPLSRLETVASANSIVEKFIRLTETAPSAAAAPAADQQRNGTSEMTVFRLPPHTRPVSYKLKMCPFLEGHFEFKGQVHIKVLVVQPTKTIILHSDQLKITNVTVTKGYRIFNVTFQLSPENQLLILKLSSEELVIKNIYDVEITFEGTLRDDMVGFYRSYYKNGNTTSWLATTQFESTYARRAFPCYDEPGYKTPFNISIARYPHQKAISNTPLKSTSDPDPTINNRVWDTFQKTPAMPTYLVAFVVSNFSYVTTSSYSFSVWARPNAIQDVGVAFSQGQKLLKQMELFTGVPYLLKKMDMVAIPDFNAGAMENWGLTTYRERYILFNDKICPTKSKEVITTVVAHELAHQWFGDYVTMSWWDSVWLNEGFATYLEYHVTDKLEPNWRMNEFFVTDVCHLALYVDGVNVHRAMTWRVNSPAEIDNQFDVISYDKAGCVIRMLEHMVSATTFKNALKLYLNSGFISGGTVTPNNLWDAFDEQLIHERQTLPRRLTVAQVMGKWSENIGYPMLTVQRVHNVGNRFNITVTQTQYNSPRSSKNVSEQEWIVPLTYTKKFAANFNETKPSLWSFPKEKLTLANEVTDNEWIMFNIQQTGYYRVNYDWENWRLLSKQLKEYPNEIHPSNRANLVDDILSLAIDQKLPFYMAFDLLEYLHSEGDTIPWFSALQKLNLLCTQLEATVAGPQLRRYFSHLITGIYKKIGFDVKPSDEHLTKTFRSSLLVVACALEHSDCISRATEAYTSSNDSSLIQPADVKNAVYCTMLKSNENGQKVWNDLWTLYRKTNVAYEKETILLSLGCATNEHLLKKYLYKLVNDTVDDIRPQYVIYVFRSIFSTTKGVTASLKFIAELMPNLKEPGERKHIMLLRILQNINARVKSEEHAKLLDELILDAEKLNQTKYGDLTSLLKDTRRSVSATMAINEKLSAAVVAGLRANSETTSLPGQSTTPALPTMKPSSTATILAPTTNVLLVFIFSSLAYTFTFTFNFNYFSHR